MKTQYKSALAKLILATPLLLLLNGCAVSHWECKIKGGGDGKPTGECKIGGQIPLQTDPLPGAELSAAALTTLSGFDPSQVSVSLAGSSFPVPDSGTIFLSMKRVDGSVFTSRYFGAYKGTDGTLKIKNPSEAKAWLQSLPQGELGEAEFQLTIPITPYTNGTQKLVYDLSYGGESFNSASGTWLADTE